MFWIIALATALLCANAHLVQKQGKICKDAFIGCAGIKWLCQEKLFHGMMMTFCNETCGFCTNAVTPKESLSLSYTEESPFVVGCFVGREGKISAGKDRFTLAKYPRGLCTHIVFDAALDKYYRAVPADEHDIQPYITEPSWYDVLRDMKKNDTNLKVLLSFGRYDKFSNSDEVRGAVPGFSEFFKEMITSSHHRRTFIFSAIELLKQHGFDGIYIDHEVFPQDQSLTMPFMELLKELRNVANRYSSVEKLKILLAKVLYGSQSQIDVYDARQLDEYLDYVFLSPVFSKNSPLQKIVGKEILNEAESGDESERNFIISAYYLHKKGLSKSKIVLGIPAYAVFGSLKTEKINNKVPWKVRPALEPGVEAFGIMPYDEICKVLVKNGYADLLEGHSLPFIFFEDKWLSFENRRSIEAKTLWLKRRKFAGAFSWTMDLDDYHGNCPKSVPFRVITTIRHYLSN